MSKISKKNLTKVIIGIVCLSFVLSYFHRPHPPNGEIVKASQEMPPGGKLVATGAIPLSSRIASSFTLALVLVKSEFSDKNATGIEFLRVWAQENFQRDPSFLHPVTLNSPLEVHHSIIDSFLFNLFAGPVYFLQEKVMDVLAHRIEQFHHSRAYISFVSVYYEIFGMDQDSAALLARYQSERAKSAVNVILCAAFWLAVTIGGALHVLTAKSGMRKSRGQWLLAYGWILVSALYFIVAWMENQAAVLASSLICGAVGLFLLKPFSLRIEEDGVVKVNSINLSGQFVAIFAWISVSLVAVRLLTWITTGTLFAPDPITLLASSWYGDFLHEPIHAKKDVKALVGILWLIYGLWTAYYVTFDPKNSAEVERTLDSLQPINK